MKRLALAVLPLALAAAAGAKTRVSVSHLKSSFHAPGGCRGNFWGGSLGRGLAEQLVTELQSAGRFELLEKPRGAHYRIEGAVTEFELCEKGGKARVNVGRLTKGLVRSVGAQASSAKVALDLRAVDQKTGAIAAAFTSRGSASAGGLDFAGALKGAGFGSEAFYRTPLGEATREALKDAAAKLAQLPERTDEPAEESAADRRPGGKPARDSGAEETSYDTGVICDTGARWLACRPLEASASGTTIKALELHHGKELALPAAKVLRLAALSGKPKPGAEAFVSCKDADFCYRIREAAKLFQKCRVVDSFESSAMMQCGRKQFDVPFEALKAGVPVDPKSI